MVGKVVLGVGFERVVVTSSREVPRAGGRLDALVCLGMGGWDCGVGLAKITTWCLCWRRGSGPWRRSRVWWVSCWWLDLRGFRDLSCGDSGDVMFEKYMRHV